MATKINKALDVNKLFGEHSKGKLLKKILQFPMYAPLKYDGNYVVALVDRGTPTFNTSGGLEYRHLDRAGEIFYNIPDGAYFAERIWGEGKLGDRNRCNLHGSKADQLSKGHNYKVFGFVRLEDYYDGNTRIDYESSHSALKGLFKEEDLSGLGRLCENQQELDEELDKAVGKGYEGVMAIQPKWKWSHHKTTRKVTFCKYKKRPTVDLLCIGITKGEGKYEGLIGSLKLQDSKGRIVDVGSGMSDDDRGRIENHFIGKVVEVFYEQIVDTYIQPTFGSEYEGVLVREDKTAEEID